MEKEVFHVRVSDDAIETVHGLARAGFIACSGCRFGEKSEGRSAPVGRHE
ncbi:unnamed protein product [[Actinomadura] parvosata subsp. kistnae]|nr:unnamed protein product [Actinomadura parvosata subsp. kistnae]